MGQSSKLIAGSIFHLAAWSPKVLFIRGNCNYSTIYRMMLPYMSAPDVCTHRERERGTEKTLEGRGSNRCWIFLRQRFDETIGGNDFPRFQRKMIANTLNSLSLSKEAHSYLEKLASTLKEKTLLSLLPFFFPFVKKSSSVAF